MQTTNIAWADYSWNPVHGCSKVSAGCANCYAETLSLRQGWTEEPWTEENAAENVTEREDKLDEPYTYRFPDGPGRVFVNSMSDLFHPQVSSEFIGRVLAACQQHPEHIWIILTKRPERAADYPGPWPENVWLGTSVEAGEPSHYPDVTHRIDELRGADARTLWVSFEPLIGPVGEVDLSGIDWAVVGGESGEDYRAPDDLSTWYVQARDIRRQCEDQDTAFFFKQAPARRPDSKRQLPVRDPKFDGIYTQQYIEEFPDLPDVTVRARKELVA